MPACSECGKTQSRLNTGSLCRECFSRTNNNGSQLDGDDYIAGINISKPLNELSVGDLVAIIREVITPLDKRIETTESEIKDIRENIESNESERNSLKNVIINQPKAIDGFHRDKRANNLIISGVLNQDGEILDDKLTLILNKIGVACSDEIVQTYRLGKKDASNNAEDYRQIMVKFKSTSITSDVIRHAKNIKGWKEDKSNTLGNREIFINIDESPLVRKENHRLRMERNRLRSLDENRNKKIVIHKGKLKIDEAIHDEFNIDKPIIVK